MIFKLNAKLKQCLKLICVIYTEMFGFCQRKGTCELLDNDDDEYEINIAITCVQSVPIPR